MPDVEILKAKEERDRTDIDELRDKVDEHSHQIAELKATSAAMSVTLGRVDANVSDIATKLDEQRQKPVKVVDGVILAGASACVGAILASVGIN